MAGVAGMGFALDKGAGFSAMFHRMIDTHFEILIVVGRYHPAWGHLTGLNSGLPAEREERGQNVATQKLEFVCAFG
jgi:hypothetical protein